LWSGASRSIRCASPGASRVAGAWIAREENRFVSIIGHDDFAAANDAYYASPERAAMDPDPARHLARVEETSLERVT
jgi:hypothetical protein